MSPIAATINQRVYACLATIGTFNGSVVSYFAYSVFGEQQRLVCTSSIHIFYCDTGPVTASAKYNLCQYIFSLYESARSSYYCSVIEQSFNGKEFSQLLCCKVFLPWEILLNSNANIYKRGR